MAAFILIDEEEREAHNALRKQRVIRDRTHPLDAYDDGEIKARYRLPRHLIMELHDIISRDLEPRTYKNNAIPPMLQIFSALRYYASGAFQHVIGDSSGFHRSSVSRSITGVTRAICRIRHRFISFPRSRQAMQRTKEEFYEMANMPNVLGAIDGTLVPIVTPKEFEPLYVSRKGGHALNILAICDAKLKFTYVVSKYPGATNVAYIWANSRLIRLFENGEIEGGYLLGDSAFALTPFLMTPKAHPINDAERNYNNAHTHTRVVIERAFGVLKHRFRCLHKSGGALTYAPGKSCNIIVACMVLHNICINGNVPNNNEEEEDGDDNEDDDVDNNAHCGQDDDEDNGEAAPANMDVWRVRAELIEQRFGQ